MSSAYTVYLNRHQLVDEQGVKIAWDDPAFLAWRAAGNAPREVGNAPEDQVDIRSATLQAVQGHLDSVASSRGYDGILSLCSYALDPTPQFSKEGRAGVAWRSAVWGAVYAYASGVEAGTCAQLSPEDLVNSLPSMTWGE